MSTMTVLGIDPGSRVQGLGLSQARVANSALLQRIIRTGDGPLGERLAVIYRRCQMLLRDTDRIQLP
ncbi:MAG: hypothetical protein Ct9H300mP13_8300 [Gammaproteobacteria bacterium]|nr:MAG: hypothetical protein Ct9H300mP13_8300 [Gammaproteobacteria bacterium]